MDTLRYVAALLVWATIPPAVLYWYALHPFVGYWRRVGTAQTLMVLIPLFVLGIGVLLRWQAPVAASDLGLSYPLFYGGLMLWIASITLDRRIRKQLDFRTLAGIPELQAPEERDGEPVLLDQGVYARVRHPRYAAVFVGTVGWALMSNYGAAYAVAALLLPALLGVIHFEERELLERFGDRYRVYRERVPALIPRLGGS